MPDIASISAAISGLKTAADIVKILRNVPASLEKGELKLKIADLMNVLADTKIHITEIQNSLDEKDNEIERLNQALAFRGKLVRQYEVYFEIDEKANAHGDPYCPHCWEVEHIGVHLHRSVTGVVKLDCPRCKNHFPFVSSKRND